MAEGREGPPPGSVKISRGLTRLATDLPLAGVGAALETTGLPGLKRGYDEASDAGDGLAVRIVNGAFGAAEEALMPLAAAAPENGKKGLRRLGDLATALAVGGVAVAVKEPAVANMLPDAVRSLADVAPHVVKTAPIEHVAAGALAARNFTSHAVDFGIAAFKNAIDQRRVPVGRPSNRYRQAQRKVGNFDY